jgi:hypothetical protein
MAVLSRDFGGIKLSGSDARTFIRQVDSGKRTVEAEKTLARGRELLLKMEKSNRIASTVASAKDRGR